MKYFKDKIYIMLLFIVAIYPLIVIPGPLDYFRGPRYIALALVSLATLIFMFYEKINIRKSITTPLVLFAVFLLIATLMADDLATAWMGSYVRFTGFSTYIFCMILYFASSRYDEPEILLKPMIYCAVIVSSIAIMQYFGLNFIPNRFYPPESREIYSTMGNTNWLGTYVVFILPASFLIYIKERKLLWLIISVFIYTGLLVSQTRGVWLSFIISILVIMFVLLINKEINKYFFKLLITLFAVTMMLLPFNEWLLMKRIYTIPDAADTTVGYVEDLVLNNHEIESLKGKDSVFERLFIWENSIEIIKNNWIFGIGADHLRLTMPSGRTETKAHNIYLSIMLEFGIFALISYIVFIIWVLKHRLKHKNDNISFILFMMVVTYLIQGFLNNDIVQIMPLFWIVLGLSVSNTNIMVNQINDDINNIQEEMISPVFVKRSEFNKSRKLVIALTSTLVLFFIFVILWYYYPRHGTIEVPGQGIYTGQLRGSTFHGYGTWEMFNGTVYEGEFKYGLYDGKGTLTYLNGSKYIGEFKLGYFSGKGKLISAEGNVTIGTWEQGKWVE